MERRKRRGKRHTLPAKNSGRRWNYGRARACKFRGRTTRCSGFAGRFPLAVRSKPHGPEDPYAPKRITHHAHSHPRKRTRASTHAQTSLLARIRFSATPVANALAFPLGRRRRNPADERYDGKGRETFSLLLNPLLRAVNVASAQTAPSRCSYDVRERTSFVNAAHYALVPPNSFP